MVVFVTLDNRQQRTIMGKMRSVLGLASTALKVSKLKWKEGEHRWDWKAP